MLQMATRTMVVVGRPTIPAVLHRLIGSKAVAAVVALMTALLRSQLALGEAKRVEKIVQSLDLCDNIWTPTNGR